MAKSRPSLGGLFKLKGKSSSGVQLTGMGTYNDVENVPDKKEERFTKSFGNYKPKILSQTSAEETRQSQNPMQSRPDKSTLSEAAQPKPDKKAFIMMGDIQNPLSMENDSASLAGSELPDELPGEDDSKMIQSTTDENKHPTRDNISSMEYDTSPQQTGSVSPTLDMVSDQSKEGTTSPVKSNTIMYDAKPSTSWTEDTYEGNMSYNDNVHNVQDIDTSDRPMSYQRITSEEEEKPRSFSQSTEDSNGMPYIPPPDYDEEVVTIDIEDEDDMYAVTPSEQKGISSRPVYRDYTGDDFGQYIQEENSVFQTPSARTQRRGAKASAKKIKSNNSAGNNKGNKKSISGTISRALFGHSAKKAGDETLKRRTIHDFSYGSSKMGYVNGNVEPISQKNRHNSAGNGVHNGHTPRQSDYELFLSSRHSNGETVGTTYITGHESNGNVNGLSKNHYATANGVSYSSPNKYHKKNGIWEKLTLRFRRKSRGEIDAVY